MDQILDVYIANTQFQPLRIFSRDYTVDEGAELAAKIDVILKNHLNAPLVFCGDFNFDSPSQILPGLFGKINLKNALPDEETRPTHSKPDHIFYSSELRCLDSHIIHTKTDHYLCIAEFGIPT